MAFQTLVNELKATGYWTEIAQDLWSWGDVLISIKRAEGQAINIMPGRFPETCSLIANNRLLPNWQSYINYI